MRLHPSSSSIHNMPNLSTTPEEPHVEWIRRLRLASLQDVKAFAIATIPIEKFPLSYIESLSLDEQHLSLRYCLVCWHLTANKDTPRHCPRELQISAALGVSHLQRKHKHQDVFLVAGTGAGKTLTSVLNQLLEESDHLTIMLCPLKRLQKSQVSSMVTVNALD